MSKTFIYFIGACKGRNMVKIGVAANPSTRLREMQTGNAESLELMAAFQVDSRRQAFQTERMLHDAFASRRVTGEWFTYNQNLHDLISAITTGDKQRAAEAIVQAKLESTKRAHSVPDTSKRFKTA